MQGSPCGIVLPNGRDCAQRAPAGSPLNLCAKHLRQAAELYASAADLPPTTRLRERCPSCDMMGMIATVAPPTKKCGMCGYSETVSVTAIPRRDRTKPEPGDPIVYYIRFGDRIKIGTTTNLTTRLAAIPHNAVLGVERGDRHIEAERHRQFHAHRISPRGEWFRPGPDLLAHIDTLARTP